MIQRPFIPKRAFTKKRKRVAAASTSAPPTCRGVIGTRSHDAIAPATAAAATLSLADLAANLAMRDAEPGPTVEPKGKASREAPKRDVVEGAEHRLAISG